MTMLRRWRHRMWARRELRHVDEMRSTAERLRLPVDDVEAVIARLHDVASKGFSARPERTISQDLLWEVLLERRHAMPFQRWRQRRRARAAARREMAAIGTDGDLDSYRFLCRAAGAYVEAFTGVVDIGYGKTLVHGGLPLCWGSALLWWRDDTLYVVGGQHGAHWLLRRGFPIAPPEVTIENATATLGVLPGDAHAYVRNLPQVLRSGLNIFYALRRRGPDPWEPIRRVYSTCQTYQHVCRGHQEDPCADVPEYLETRLLFERRGRILFEWTQCGNYSARGGYVLADGDSVQYGSTEEHGIITCLSLEGALLRAAAGLLDGGRVLRLLLNMRDDALIGYRMEQAGTVGEDTYRLRFSRGGRKSYSSEAVTVDAARHAMLAVETDHRFEGQSEFTRVEYEPVFNAPVPGEVFHEPRGVVWLRRRVADVQLRHNVAWYRRCGPDLGLTAGELDERIAAIYLHTLLGTCGACSYDRFQSGLAMRAGDSLFWWRDGVMYAVDPEDNPYDIPLVPAEVTAQGVREVLPPPGDADGEGLKENLVVSGSLMMQGRNRPPKHNTWDALRQAYRACRTYHHIARGRRDLVAPAITEHAQFEVRLYFERPHRVALDWEIRWEDGRPASAGWVRADETSVRFHSERDNEMADFTLQGALKRATWALHIDQQILQMLLPEIELCMLEDEAPYRRERNGASAAPASGYRLVRQHCDSPAFSFEIDPLQPQVAYHVDAARHLIRKYEASLEDEHGRAAWQIEYEPQMNISIPAEVWQRPIS